MDPRLRNVAYLSSNLRILTCLSSVSVFVSSFKVYSKYGFNDTFCMWMVYTISVLLIQYFLSTHELFSKFTIYLLNHMDELNREYFSITHMGATKSSQSAGPSG